ncbi:MAG: ABC transporter permease, partial [Pseudomonadales bacterium]|nr:ABC transporter permease [Pseudomonadales bacterium]
MADSVAWFVGLRYSGTRANSLFLSFISLISLIGVTLGVIALTIVVSVMNGFDSELKKRILGAIPHVVVESGTPVDGEKLLEHSRVTAAAPFMRRQGMLIEGAMTQLVSVYGIVPEEESRISDIPKHVEESLATLMPAGENAMVVGRALAYRAGLAKGDRVMLIIPEPSGSGRVITPKIGRVKVTGFFEMGSELDYRLAFVRLEDLQTIAGVEEYGYRLAVDDIFAAPLVAKWLASRLDKEAKVSDWTKEYGNFFETVRMEKIMMFVLLTLVIAIAAFNIVSSLSMMVKEKQSDIAVLRTLGMSSGRVMMVFVIQGGLIGVLGTLLGLVLGLPLAIHIPDIVGFFEQAFGA